MCSHNIKPPINISIKDFLSLFCGPDDKILILAMQEYATDAYKRDASGWVKIIRQDGSAVQRKKTRNRICTWDTLDKTLKQLSIDNRNEEQNQCGIFFISNIGNGYKDADINKPSSMKLDIDFKGSQAEIQKQKLDAYDRLMSHPIKPSIVVESKSGLHVYYLVDSVDTAKEMAYYKPLEQVMVDYWRSDPKCVNPARQLRLPGYYHLKDRDNPYMISVIYLDKTARYTYEDIMAAYGVTWDSLAVKKQKTKASPKAAEAKPEEYDYKPIACPKSLSNQYGNFGDYLEACRAVPVQDVIYRLYDRILPSGANKLFCCLYHDDKSPSAAITQDNKYLCYSHNCQVQLNHKSGWSALDIARQYFGTFGRAMKWIETTYGIVLIKSQWHLNQLAKYADNKVHIYSDMQETPVFARYMTARRLRVYNALLDYAMINIYDRYQLDGEAIVFASSEFLANKVTKINKGDINTVINELTAIGLIRKIDHHDISHLIPRGIYDTAQQSKKQIVSYYVIPPIMDVVAEAEKKIKTLKTLGITRKNNINRKLLLRINLTEAIKVYPNTMQGINADLSDDEVRMVNICTEIIKGNGLISQSLLLQHPQIRKGKLWRAKERDKLFNGIITLMIAQGLLERSRLTRAIKDSVGVDDPIKSIIYVPVAETSVV